MDTRGGHWVGALWCFYFYILLLHAKVSHSKNQSCNANDFNALVDFLGDIENGIHGWSLNGSSSECCSWPGISCASMAASGRRVVGLHLSSYHLKGTVSASLAGLDQLRHLDLSNNSLGGSIPSWLFHLSKMELLDLSGNMFRGSIPLDLSIPSIQVFNISSNFFNGSHPILTYSTNLMVFDISDNMFSGAIDMSICDSSSPIDVLCFSMNKFSGNVPSGFGNCSSLRELSLDGNALNGSLPEDFFKIQSLTKLNLHDNILSGTLSPSIRNLSQLVHIDLSLNLFSGSIPDVFGSLVKLESFVLSSNEFHGTLPPSLSNCSELKVLSLTNNSLSGQIDLNFTALAELIEIGLSSNQFYGPIPSRLLQCLKMESLHLDRNKLSGRIPDEFKNLHSLSDLFLSKNNFSNLSAALQILHHLPNLMTLVLTKNFHGEQMPTGGIQGFKNLQVFVIANSALSGAIPPWLASSGSLKVLDMSWNHLSGRIPAWLGNLDQLFYLDLSSNSLTGQLPESLTQMKNLMSGNGSNLRMPIQDSPFFVKKNSNGKVLRYKQISSFPPSLILGYNMLVGPVLPGFGNLIGLHVLDLSWNNFSGAIPNELSSMSSLELLNLSHNNLTGSIPSSLTKLSFLSAFDVSYNNLAGMIPTGGQFSTFPCEDFEVNLGLFGSSCTPEAPKELENRQHNDTAPVAVMAYISVELGYIVGLFIVWIVLLFARAWRATYFQLVDKFFDMIYVVTMVTVNRFKRKWEDKEHSQTC